MKIKLLDILNEEGDNQRGKFFNYLFPKLVEYFETKYVDNDAVDNASWMDSQDVYHYKEKIKQIKEKGEEIQTYMNAFKNVENLEPTEVNRLQSAFFEISGEIRDDLNLMGHIGQLFDPFTQDYNVPVTLMLELWEKYYEEIYLPGKKTKNKSLMGRDLYHGLDGLTIDGGDLEVINYFKSIHSSDNDFYVVIKDKSHNDFLLGFNIQWDWGKVDGSLDVNNLYYLPFKSLKDIKDYILDDQLAMFFADIKHEHKYDITNINERDAQILYDMTMNNFNEIMGDSEGDDEEAISYWLEYNADDVSDYLETSDYRYFGRIFSKLKEVRDSITL